MAQPSRFAALAIVLAGGLAALVWRAGAALPDRDAAAASIAPGTLAWVATAHQLGVVGYRDPPGAISPDGRLLAFAEGREVRVTPVAGGAVTTLARAGGQVRALLWSAPDTIIFEDPGDTARWWRVDIDGAAARPVWSADLEVRSGEAAVRPATLRQLAVSPDTQMAAGLAADAAGPALWTVALDGTRPKRVAVPASASAPAWSPAGAVACIVREGTRARLSLPCGREGRMLTPDIDVVGPLAFGRSGAPAYFASPNANGFVDLWRAPSSAGRATRLTAFARDSYAPSVGPDDTVLLRVQSYRTHVADIDLAAGRPRQLSTFQAETPSYHPDGQRIAVTYGTWRRVIDDAHYPDIAQEIGVLRAGPDAGPQDAPAEVIARSDSEDQAMAWSPNGRWIAFHSHREQSDDVWLRPADGSRPDRRISFLGRGAEVGWPRWSPDGTTVAFGGASPRTGHGALFTIAVNQETGEPAEAHEVAIDGVDAEWTSAEWLPDSRTLAVIGKTGPGRQVIVTVPTGGGSAVVRRRIDSEHDFPGLAVSPDGRELAFVARADDGWFQVFRVPLGGGDAAAPVQVTRDAGHKTQPAWAPDGRRLAYTVWSYDAQFWTWRAAR